MLTFTLASAFAAPPPGCPTATEDYLKARLAFWQQRMELQDWKITISMASPTDLHPDTLGNIHWDADHRTAVIHVLDAAAYATRCSATLDDLEMTVVHELVHLELSGLPRSPASRGDEEHAVVRITDALLAAEKQRAAGDQARR